MATMKEIIKLIILHILRGFSTSYLNKKAFIQIKNMKLFY